MFYRFKKWSDTRREDIETERAVCEFEHVREKLGETAATHSVLKSERTPPSETETTTNILDMTSRLDPRTSVAAANAVLASVRVQPSHVKIISGFDQSALGQEA